MDGDPDGVQDQKLDQNFQGWRARKECKGREKCRVDCVGFGIDGLKQDAAFDTGGGSAFDESDFGPCKGDAKRQIEEIADRQDLKDRANARVSENDSCKTGDHTKRDKVGADEEAEQVFAAVTKAEGCANPRERKHARAGGDDQKEDGKGEGQHWRQNDQSARNGKQGTQDQRRVLVFLKG